MTEQPTEATLAAALRKIVQLEIRVQEGGHDKPVLWLSQSCQIAIEALGLTRDEQLAIARSEVAKTWLNN